ncbi:MAG: hypothetical protein NTU82_04520 [Actinobacteria bacterium]|nr:hypothetical protein [Actinomycetota bacterium]
MNTNDSKGAWYLVNGVARFWDGKEWVDFDWDFEPGWYEFQGLNHYWNGIDWETDTPIESEEPKPKFKQDWEYELGGFEEKEIVNVKALGFEVKQDWEYSTWRESATLEDGGSEATAMDSEIIEPQANQVEELSSLGKDMGNSFLGCLIIILVPLIVVFLIAGIFAGTNVGGAAGYAFAIICFLLFVGVSSQIPYLQALFGWSFISGGIGFVLISFIEPGDSKSKFSFGLIMGLTGVYFLGKLLGDKR